MVFVKRKTVKRTVRLEPVERQSRTMTNEDARLSEVNVMAAFLPPGELRFKLMWRKAQAALGHLISTLRFCARQSRR